MVNLGEDIGNSQWGTQVLEGSDWKVVQPITAISVLQGAEKIGEQAGYRIRQIVDSTMNSQADVAKKFSDVLEQLDILSEKGRFMIAEWLKVRSSTEGKVSENIAIALRFLEQVGQDPSKDIDLPKELQSDTGSSMNKWLRKVMTNAQTLWMKWFTIATLPVVVPVVGVLRKVLGLAKKKAPYSLGGNNLSNKQALEVLDKLYTNTPEFEACMSALRNTPKDLESTLGKAYTLYTSFKALREFITTEEYKKLVNEYQLSNPIAINLIEANYQGMIWRTSNGETGMLKIVQAILLLMETSPVQAQAFEDRWDTARCEHATHHMVSSLGRDVQNVWAGIRRLGDHQLASHLATQENIRAIAAVSWVNAHHSAILLEQETAASLAHVANMRVIKGNEIQARARYADALLWVRLANPALPSALEALSPWVTPQISTNTPES